MKSRLDFIEARLQAVIESSAALFPLSGDPSAAEVSHLLVEAMQQNILTADDDTVTAPDLFTLTLPTSTYARWQPRQELLDSLVTALQEEAGIRGVEFAAAPLIRLASSDRLAAGGIEVTAAFTQDISHTAALELPPDEDDPTSPANLPANAFLIVDGSKTFPLLLAVVNIGRRLNNHIVVDDPRVSRTHAQLRAVRGRFIIFDLNSSGGTFVNSQRITRQALKAGDVISLSGVPIIYGEDAPAGVSKTNAIPVNPEKKP